MDHGEDLLQSRLVRRLGEPGLRAEVRELRGEGGGGGRPHSLARFEGFPMMGRGEVIPAGDTDTRGCSERGCSMPLPAPVNIQAPY